jgi:hypothetical protein
MKSRPMQQMNGVGSVIRKSIKSIFLSILFR